MAVVAKPHVLLLGGGYTLQRVAELLPSDSFVITSRSAETCGEWKRRGWNAQGIPTLETVRALGIDYPDVVALVEKHGG